MVNARPPLARPHTLFKVLLMAAAAQKNITVGVDEEKQAIVSGNPGFKYVIETFDELSSYFFHSQGRVMRIGDQQSQCLFGSPLDAVRQLLEVPFKGIGAADLHEFSSSMRSSRVSNSFASPFL